MVKRTITITTILLILTMVVSLIVVLNRSSFAADGDIASGTSGTCSWVIDANGMMTIRPTNGVSGTLENHPSGYNYNIFSRYQNDITKIVIMPGVKTNSQCNWLLGSLPNCTEMDLHNLDVSGSYNLNSMFRHCYKLEKINVTGWNVTNAKDVSYMFANCHALKDIIGIETWQLQNVTNTDGLFSSCIVLESVDISNFNMHNVTNARLMFSTCPKLKSITIGENFNFICNISNEENLVTFPTYASKWVRSDREYGPYTPVELRENYTPEMAGTWVWEQKEESIPDDPDEPDLPEENGHRYKVEYFFDGVLDDSLDESFDAELDAIVSATPVTPFKHENRNYTLVSKNHNITISINDEDNIIKVYYETDVLDYAIDGDEIEGDGVPDKYQIRITYKVENGSWNDGTKNNKVNVITLYDKDGNPSENGTGNTKIPEVGSKPNKGYTYGYWNRNIPSKVTNKDDGKEYVYSYEIVKTIEADIAEGKGKSSNPKTDDIVNRYLLAGVGGILVLTLVSRIRRRYSRKAKKIQF